MEGRNETTILCCIRSQKTANLKKVSNILDYSSTILHVTLGRDHLLRIQDTGACLQVHETSQFIIMSDGCTKVFYMLPLLNKTHLTLQKSTRTEGRWSSRSPVKLNNFCYQCLTYSLYGLYQKHV